MKMVKSLRKYLFKINREGTNLTPINTMLVSSLKTLSEACILDWVISTVLLLIKLVNISSGKVDCLMSKGFIENLQNSR